MSTHRPDDHAAFRLLAAAAVDGWIDPFDAADLEAHLATCPACRAEQQAMLADHMWLASPARATAPDLRVRAAVFDAARSPRIPRTSGAGRQRVMFAAAVLAVSVVGGGLLLAARFVPPAGSIPTSSTDIAATRKPTSRPTPTTQAPPSPPLGPCAPVPAGLTAWWRGDDTNDAVGGHDGILRGSASFAQGLVGRALTLDGLTSYMEVPPSADLDLGSGDFTIMLWVRFVTVAGEQIFLEQWQERSSGAPTTAGWSLLKENSGGIHFVAADGLWSGSAGTAPLNLQVGRWYHLAARRQDDVIVIYLDGSLVGGNDQIREALDISLERPLLFGRRGDDRGLLLNGQLDEVKMVVGRALFESDIRADYLAGATGACPS